MKVMFGYNWQILMTPSIRFEWVWPSQCDCGRGHLVVSIFGGPFLLEIAL